MLILCLKERCRIFYKNLRRPFKQNYIFSHPVLFGVFSIILTTLVILVTVVLMIYLGVYLGFVQGESGLIFRFNHFTVHLILELKVLALNCWGMPGSIKLTVRGQRVEDKTHWQYDCKSEQRKRIASI